MNRDEWAMLVAAISVGIIGAGFVIAAIWAVCGDIK